jgi:isopentenyl diphosphate isomerase/L-lactate dehydrogenase-like FMN-dependent dehydrogenase
VLAPGVGDFLQGGAGQEVRLDANREAFGRWQFRPSTATSVLGLPLSMPVLTAPFGADGLFHHGMPHHSNRSGFSRAICW